MGKTRDEFLSKHWTRYPEMPRGALKWGRVEQLRLGVQNLTDWTFKDHPETKAADVLNDGDLIALLPANKLILLAPNQTQRTARSERWSQHRRWHEFLGHIRNIFKEKRFLEVKTPVLVICPGTEPSLEPFETELKLGTQTKKLFLPTSPELNLKKLLAEGAERVFEIAPVFRNGENTDRHRPEFTMLEWYRSFAHLSTIRLDTIELIEFAADLLKVERPKEVLSFTMAELFQQHCHFDLTPNTNLEELRELALKLNVDVKSAQTIDDFFYLIFMEKIENRWPQDRLVFVEKYPPYQAALARIGADAWAERFEVYWKGFELANAFHELNDPDLQRLRAIEDVQKKVSAGKKELPLDESFFSALDFGLPPSAGIALGLERLYMALTDTKNINQINSIFESEV